MAGQMNVLMRDGDGTPIAATCTGCGRFTLNTQTYLCTRCLLAAELELQRRAANERIVTAAADAWLREGRC